LTRNTKKEGVTPKNPEGTYISVIKVTKNQTCKKHRRAEKRHPTQSHGMQGHANWVSATQYMKREKKQNLLKTHAISHT
jgi:hypothetical protein